VKVYFIPGLVSVWWCEWWNGKWFCFLFF